MSNKVKKEQKYDQPYNELSASSKKVKNKVITAAQSFNKNSWLQISQWLVIFKVFILIGVTIFTIGQFSGVSDTDLAAYMVCFCINNYVGS